MRLIVILEIIDSLGHLLREFCRTVWEASEKERERCDIGPAIYTYMLAMLAHDDSGRLEAERN